MNKKIILKDIAKELGVSITTVSKVINKHPDISNATRKRVLSYIKKIEYIPNFTAQNLRKKVTKFVGLIISDNSNPFYAEVIRNAEREIVSRNYHTIIFNNEENPEKEVNFIKELISINVAGIIISPARGNIESIKILKQYEIPYVLCNRYINKKRDYYVIADDFKAGFIATEYLLKSRSEKIIFLNGFKGISCARDRLLGHEAALKENNLRIIKNQFYEDIINSSDGYNIMEKILTEHKPPFAILCISDFVATGVIKYLIDNGIKIPDQICVMGIDNVQKFSYSFSIPSLTTIDIPQNLIGSNSALMLFNLINNLKNPDGNHIIFEPKLVIRDSA